MNIRFGSNEYALVPGSSVQPLGEKLEIQLLAEDLDVMEVESVLSDVANTETLVIVDDKGAAIQVVKGWTKLDSLRKEYDVLYWTDYEEVIITPEHIDPDTGAIIPAETQVEPIEHRADILYVHMVKPGLEGQVDENTANIEFIAIMSDIEL